ncbi:ABC transporter permease subunit [Mycoplasmopsis fermentans]|uniref:ABC transporter permease subunit n=1 Tax=Mycoplasmopsis fermentans TaxID=2115 RepID=UPI0001E32F23|nr:ABC transporter permease subunit [Mycoplasmopsis fermentans]ADN69181.1 maltodextrin ABC transporter permease protein [Mycoplasmopsis fermentans JER]
MEKLKLFNWYGEEFDTILSEEQDTLKAYKHHVRNVVNRRIDKINSQMKINKNLFLRARTKLQDNLKRELSSLYAAYSNKIKAIKDAIKKISFADNEISMIKYEIKALTKEKKALKKYVLEFQKSLRLTADIDEKKNELLEELKQKTIKEENKILSKYALFNITLKYLKHNSDLDFDINKIKNYLHKQELKILNTLEDPKSYFQNFYQKLEKRRLELIEKRNSLNHKYQNNKFIELKIYKANKYNIKLETNQKNLALEYEYNQKAELQKQEVKAYKKEAYAKIEEHKNEIKRVEKGNIEKIKKIKQNGKSKIKIVNQNFKQQLKKIDDLVATRNYQQYLEFLAKNNFIDSNIDESIKITKKSVLQSFKKNKQLVYNDKKTSALAKIFKKLFFGFFNTKSLKKEFEWLLKSELYFKESAIYEKYSYEGNYKKELALALKERAINAEQVRLKFLYEKVLAIYETKLNSLNLSSNENSNILKEQVRNKEQYQSEKELVSNKKKQLYNQYLETVKQTALRYKNKEISKQAFKHSKMEAKIDYNEKRYELKLQTNSLKNKEILSTWFFRRQAEMKVVSKIYESKVNEAVKTVPIECTRNIKWLAAIISFIFPGLSELIFFKQKTKGILLLLVTTLLYAIFIPFSFGAYTTGIDGMEGILSFIDLGARHFNSSMGIFRDARRYLFGGVISVIILTIVLIYFTVCSIIAFRTAKLMEEGSRPSKWSYTKRWLNTSGFPWMISITGWILMLFIVLAPIITSVLISFTDYGYMHQAPTQPVHWVGLKQWGLWWIYRNNGILTALERIIGWTFIWTIASTLCPISLGIILAILANNNRLKGRKFFRLIFIIPWAIPAFVMLYFLRSAFVNGTTGYINMILLKLHFVNRPIEWLNNITSARAILIVVQTWIAYAFIFMLVTGNLQAIPKDIYEAASIDGAKNYHKFFKLTLPSLLLAIAPMLIGQFVGAFNNFTTISIFSGGGPAFAKPTAYQEGATDILISFIYKLATGAVKIESDQAFAAALTTLAALLSIAVAARGFIKSMTRRD